MSPGTWLYVLPAMVMTTPEEVKTFITFSVYLVTVTAIAIWQTPVAWDIFVTACVAILLPMLRDPSSVLAGAVSFKDFYSVGVWFVAYDLPFVYFPRLLWTVLRLAIVAVLKVFPRLYGHQWKRTLMTFVLLPLAYWAHSVSDLLPVGDYGRPWVEVITVCFFGYFLWHFIAYTEAKVSSTPTVVRLGLKAVEPLKPLARAVILMHDLYSMQSFGDFTKILAREWANSTEEEFARVTDCISVAFGISQEVLFGIAKEPPDLLGLNSVPASFGDKLGDAKQFFRRGRLIRDTDLYKAFHKLGKYLMFTTLGTCIGLRFDTSGYSDAYARAVQYQYNSESWDEFVLFLGETAVDFLQTGYKIYMGKGVSEAVLGEQDVTKFFEEYDRITSVINSASTGEDVDFRQVCLDAEALLLASRSFKKSDFSVLLHAAQRDLQQRVLKMRVNMANSGTRKLAYGVMLHGPSEIGKSSVTNMIFNMYALYSKKHNPDIVWDPATSKYVRTTQDFWDSYNFQWALVLDDIAWETRKKLTSLPKTSIDEVIQIMNNVVYSTNQAALEDKGTKPLMAKCVVATTNVLDLNAHVVAETPSAVHRRLPIIVEPVVKDEFRKKGSHALDSAKAGDCKDLWWFRVKEVRIAHNPDTGHSVTERIPVRRNNRDLLNLYEFNEYMKASIEAHEDNQALLKKKLGEVASECTHGNMSYACEKCVNSVPVSAGGDEHLWEFRGWSFDRFMAALLTLLDFSCYPYVLSFVSWFIGTRVQLIKPSLVVHAYFAKAKKQRIAVLALGLLTAILLAKHVGGFRFRPVGGMGSKSEMKNIWAKAQDDEFDPPGATRHTSIEGLRGCVGKRSVFLLHVSAPGYKSHARSLGIGGQWFATISHLFPDRFDKFEVTLVRGSQGQPLTFKRTFTLHRKDMRFEFDQDVVFFTHPSLPPVKDIRKFFVDGEPTPGPGELLYLEEGASDLQRLPLTRVGTGMDMMYQTVSQRVHKISYGTFCRDPLIEEGSCGTPALVALPNAVFIAGVVVCAEKNFSGPLGIGRITQSMVASLPITISDGPPDYFMKEGTLGKPMPLHAKSPLRHESLAGEAVVQCSFDGRRSSPKSRTGPSIVADTVKEVFVDDTLPDFRAPMMKGELIDGEWVDPVLVNLDKRIHTTNLHDLDTLNDCRDSLIEEFAQVVDFSKIKPVGLDEALNGIEFDDFSNRLPFKTSGGWNFPGPKRKYIDSINGVDVPNAEVIAGMNDIKSRYLTGETARVMFDSHLKDEAVASEKVRIGKTRMFTGSSFDCSLVIREQFLTVTSEITQHGLELGIAAGLNHYARWGEIYFALIGKDGERRNRCAAGDHSGFDTSMGPMRIRAGMEVLIELCRRSGNFSSEELLIQEGIMLDLCFPTVNINGDVVRFFGTNCSGHPLTLMLNSIVNLLDVRYAYVKALGRKPEEFTRDVTLFVMGDDNLFSVAPGVEFGHTVLQKELAKVGLKYTMADKESESVDFLPVEQVDFLKRRFRIDGGIVMCPLDETSIFKSIMTVTQSKLSSEEQMAQILTNAVREWALYGHDVFKKRRAQLCLLLSKHEDVHAYIPLDFYRPFGNWIRDTTGQEHPDYPPVDSSSGSEVVEAVPVSFVDECPEGRIDSHMCDDSPSLYLFNMVAWVWLEEFLKHSSEEAVLRVLSGLCLGYLEMLLGAPPMHLAFHAWTAYLSSRIAVSTHCFQNGFAAVMWIYACGFDVYTSFLYGAFAGAVLFFQYLFVDLCPYESIWDLILGRHRLRSNYFRRAYFDAREIVSRFFTPGDLPFVAWYLHRYGHREFHVGDQQLPSFPVRARDRRVQTVTRVLTPPRV